jgi:hypothetical protein
MALLIGQDNIIMMMCKPLNLRRYGGRGEADGIEIKHGHQK